MTSPSAIGSSEDSEPDVTLVSPRVRGRPPTTDDKNKSRKHKRKSDPRSNSSEIRESELLVERRKSLASKMEIPETPNRKLLGDVKKESETPNGIKKETETINSTVQESKTGKLRRFNLSMTPQSSPDVKKTPGPSNTFRKSDGKFASPPKAETPKLSADNSKKLHEKTADSKQNEPRKSNSGGIIVTLPNIAMTEKTNKHKTCSKINISEKLFAPDNAKYSPITSKRATRSEISTHNGSSSSLKHENNSELVKILPRPPGSGAGAKMTRAEASKLRARQMFPRFDIKGGKRKWGSNESNLTSQEKSRAAKRRLQCSVEASKSEVSNNGIDSSQKSTKFSNSTPQSEVNDYQESKRAKHGQSVQRLPSLKDYKIPKNRKKQKSLKTKNDENEIKNGDLSEESDDNDKEASPKSVISTRNSSRSPDKSEKGADNTTMNGATESNKNLEPERSSPRRKDVSNRTDSVYPLRKVTNNSPVCQVNTATLHNNNNINIDVDLSNHDPKRKNVFDAFFVCDSTVSSDGEIGVQVRTNSVSSTRSYNIEEPEIFYESESSPLAKEVQCSDSNFVTSGVITNAHSLNLPTSRIVVEESTLPDSTTPDVEMIISSKTKRTDSSSDEIPSPKQAKICHSPKYVDRSPEPEIIRSEFLQMRSSEQKSILQANQNLADTASSQKSDLKIKTNISSNKNLAVEVKENILNIKSETDLNESSAQLENIGFKTEFCDESSELKFSKDASDFASKSEVLEVKTEVPELVNSLTDDEGSIEVCEIELSYSDAEVENEESRQIIYPNSEIENEVKSQNLLEENEKFYDCIDQSFANQASCVNEENNCQTNSIGNQEYFDQTANPENGNYETFHDVDWRHTTSMLSQDSSVNQSFSQEAPNNDINNFVPEIPIGLLMDNIPSFGRPKPISLESSSQHSENGSTFSHEPIEDSFESIMPNKKSECSAAPQDSFQRLEQDLNRNRTQWDSPRTWSGAPGNARRLGTSPSSSVPGSFSAGSADFPWRSNLGRDPTPEPPRRSQFLASLISPSQVRSASLESNPPPIIPIHRMNNNEESVESWKNWRRHNNNNDQSPPREAPVISPGTIASAVGTSSHSPTDPSPSTGRRIKLDRRSFRQSTSEDRRVENPNPVDFRSFPLNIPLDRTESPENQYDHRCSERPYKHLASNEYDHGNW